VKVGDLVKLKGTQPSQLYFVGVIMKVGETYCDVAWPNGRRLMFNRHSLEVICEGK